MSDFKTFDKLGIKTTHHRCVQCGEFSPIWQALCICHPEYARQAVQKLREVMKNE
jgi:hypothetical protein